MCHLITGKPMLALTALVILLVGFVLVGQLVDFQEALNPENLARLLETSGPWAPLILVMVMAAAVVISPIPSLPIDLAAGATFGPLLGTTYAVIGAEIGAIISFLIGRALGRELLSKVFRRDVTFCERCSAKHLMILLGRGGQMKKDEEKGSKKRGRESFLAMSSVAALVRPTTESSPARPNGSKGRRGI